MSAGNNHNIVVIASLAVSRLDGLLSVYTTQKYLAAKSIYRSCIPSGETEEDILLNSMELYRLSDPVEFLEAVRLLSKRPKFSGVEGRRVRSRRVQEDGAKKNSIQGGNIAMDTPSEERPMGIKHIKLIDGTACKTN